MTRPEVLLAAPGHPPLDEGLETLYRVHRLPADASAQASLLAEVGPRLRVVATSGGYGLPLALGDALPALELVAVFGVGVDRVDLAWARARGVQVTNTPDVLNEDVADMAIALWLAAARRLPQADRYVREGGWRSHAPLALASRASGRRVGLVGMGRIGRAIARRAEPFAAEIAYHSRNPLADVAHRHFASLVDLADWAEVLIVITPGGEATRHLIGPAVIEALGSRGLLVNVARGSVVDEAALVEALAQGRLGGAGLDVFAHEPEVPTALLAMDNVVLQPHRGSATHETREGMAELVLANIEAFFAGRPLVTPVT